MRGSAASATPGACTRRGPSHCSGDARSEKIVDRARVIVLETASRVMGFAHALNRHVRPPRARWCATEQTLRVAGGVMRITRTGTLHIEHLSEPS